MPKAPTGGTMPNFGPSILGASGCTHAPPAKPVKFHQRHVRSPDKWAAPPSRRTTSGLEDRFAHAAGRQ